MGKDTYLLLRIPWMSSDSSFLKNIVAPCIQKVCWGNTDTPPGEICIPEEDSLKSGEKLPKQREVI